MDNSAQGEDVPMPSRELVLSHVNIFAPEQGQHRVALVIQDDMEVVGFIVGRLLDQECEIENVAIRGAARRRGLGSRLLGEFLDFVRSRGVREIWPYSPVKKGGRTPAATESHPGVRRIRKL